MHKKSLMLGLALLALASPLRALADDYHPITDPFGDPNHPTSNENEEPEGGKAPAKPEKPVPLRLRHLMAGFDAGLAGFTGGLGQSTPAGLYLGGRFIYFLSKKVGVELGVHYSSHTDTVHNSRIATSVLPVTGSLRWYAWANSTSHFLGVLSPYFVGGAGIYIRNQNVQQTGGLEFKGNTNATTNNFGVNAGMGFEINLYRGHYFLGGDFRYHLVFFNDESSTFGGVLVSGARSGDYFTTNATLSYNF